MRPCFLVVDNEYPESISTRKLVIETAKMNVITTYSAKEAIETLMRFPAVDGVVLDSHIHGVPCAELVERLRQIRPNLPIVVVSPGGDERCDGEHHRVSSYNPRELLEKLQQLCPTEYRQAIARDEELGRKS
ncbi:MAG TPA: response regulator [Terracidiphilus sp.]|jgi:CheY-like chemotaxis protein|nr:response regulator [Terracidiphilus sp.]